VVARHDGLRCWRGEQAAALVELVGAMAIGEKAVVADAMEAVGKAMRQEAATFPIESPLADIEIGVSAASMWCTIVPPQQSP
jgi:hypothetical protein